SSASTWVSRPISTGQTTGRSTGSCTLLLAAPGGDFDLVAVGVVEIERVHRHERVLPAAELESKTREPLALSVVIFGSDLESDVVERAGVYQRLLTHQLARDQHHLLRDARALHHIGRRDGLQPKSVTIERHGSADVLNDQHDLDQATNACHPSGVISGRLRCDSRAFECGDI